MKKLIYLVFFVIVISASLSGQSKGISFIWKGLSTDWTDPANWQNGFVPPPSGLISIPGGLANYPNASDITIGATGSLTLEPGASISTVTFNNAGLVVFKSSATQTSTLFAYYFSLTGQTRVEMFLTGGVSGTGPRWHWITSPFTINKSVFTTNPTNDNLLNYTESSVTTGINDGWNWHDGYQGTQSFSTLDAFKGYDVYYSSDQNIVLTGGAFEVTGYYPTVVNLDYSGNDNTLHGWNFVGNPYMCAMNWSLIGKTSGVHNALYLSRDNGVATYIGGLGTNGATDIIPPLQGFFVKVDGAGQTLSFSRGASSLNVQPRYKGLEVPDSIRIAPKTSKALTDTIRYVRINISKNGMTDESIIRIQSDASDAYDNDYDATKFLGGAAIPQIYSTLQNVKYAINSIAIPDPEKSIPVSVSVPAAGDYSINCTQITGMWKYKVTLKDNTNQQEIDLRNVKVYNFHTDAAGVIDNRFVITITKILTSNVVPEVNKFEFNIFTQQGIINIIPLQDEWNGKKGEIRILSLSGKTVADRTNIYFSKDTPETFNLNLPNGIYIVTATSQFKRYTGKISIIR